VTVPRGIRALPNYVLRASEDVLAVESVVRPSARLTGQKFASTPEYRQAVEAYAMRLAHEHYSRLWTEVIDVSKKESFDLLCRNGDIELRVEVKGTASAGESVLLSRNEVRHAQEHPGHVALFVVSGVKVDAAGVAGGGVIARFEPWNIDDTRLDAIAYECHLNRTAAVFQPAAEPFAQPDGILRFAQVLTG